MIKVYPKSFEKDDKLYDCIRELVCGLLCMVCICVGIIVLLILFLEKNIDDGSY